MLLDTISYAENFPIEVGIFNLRGYPIHYHEDFEMLYVLRGSAIVKCGCNTQKLNSGELVTIAGGLVHGIRSLHGECTILALHIGKEFFSRYFPDQTSLHYRTQTDETFNPELGYLREIFLQLANTYLTKPDDYKMSCIGFCSDIINILNESFSLFAVDDSSLREFQHDNPAVARRIIKVFQYTSNNLTRKVSLSDIADEEGISTYYLSHLIKDVTGMSFRELVSFARTEVSERYLLDGQTKISRIPKLVGFSTSKYYEEAFQRWYRCTPKEFQAIYRNMILSPENPADMEFLTVSESLDLIEQNQFLVVSTNRRLTETNYTHRRLTYRPQMAALKELQYDIDITVTTEDYRTLGEFIIGIIYDLKCSHVMLQYKPEDTPKELHQVESLLVDHDIAVTKAPFQENQNHPIYGFDTVIAPIHLLVDRLFSDEANLTIPLRAQAGENEFLSGTQCLVTANGTRTPSYYALKLLSNSHGKLLLLNENYCLAELDGETPAYMVFALNYSSKMLDFCRHPASLRAIDQSLREYRDELSLDLSMQIPLGKYMVTKYTLNHYNSLFHQMSLLHFPKKLTLAHPIPLDYNTVPAMETRITTISGPLETNITFRGVGLQVMLLQQV